MAFQEENMTMIKQFLDKGEPQVLIIFLTSAGQLQPALNFPFVTKTKAVYFAKRLGLHTCIYIHCMCMCGTCMYKRRYFVCVCVCVCVCVRTWVHVYIHVRMYI